MTADPIRHRPSDYPNQVNNVLCFPFIFRGALDAGATDINEPMKLACVDALAGLARREPSDLVTAAYGGKQSRFGPNMLIPRPFDPRLLTEIAPAVARAAMASGVATRPIDDFDAYQERLTGFVFRSGLVMKPLFERARKRGEAHHLRGGEERRVLQAVQQVVAQGLARPILVGRPKVILSRIESLGLDLVPERDFDLVNILHDARFRTYWSEYHRVMGRSGVSPDEAKNVVRSRGTAVAALAIRLGDADAMLCGTVGTFHDHLRYVRGLIGTREGVRDLSTMSAHILPSGTFFICDTHITPEPSAEEIVEMTMLACAEIRAFGMEPKVALLSRSNFGTHDSPTAERMRVPRACSTRSLPSSRSMARCTPTRRCRSRSDPGLLPDSRLKGQANLLVMPNVEAANIAHNLLRALGGGVSIGPIVIGAARSAHVVTQTITVRGIVNMTALAVAQVDAVRQWRGSLSRTPSDSLRIRKSMRNVGPRVPDRDERFARRALTRPRTAATDTMRNLRFGAMNRSEMRVSEYRDRQTKPSPAFLTRPQTEATDHHARIIRPAP